MPSPARLPLALAAALGLCVALAGVVAFTQAADDTITLRVIVVSSADAAQAIAARLGKGEDFAVVAKAESTAPSADDGGLLGRVPLAELRPEVRSALQGLTPGRVTGVVRIPTGFAIFKVEANAPGGSSGPSAVTPALAASGAVKFVLDVSGFSETQIALAEFAPPSSWNSEPRAGCDARRQSIAGARSALEGHLKTENGNALSSQSPLDVMQLYIALGELDAFEGRMDAAIDRFEGARRVAAANMPDAVPSIEETLGVAFFHKAEMDNGAYATPGSFCLLSPRPTGRFADVTAMNQAIAYLTKYADRRSDGELEARWMLNLAYMRIGGYPDNVPAQWLIPPSAFESAEDVGRFHDVAAAAGLNSFHGAGGAIVDDFRNTGRLDVVLSTLDKCETMTFFANNGDGTFSDRTVGSGLDAQFGGLNIIQGDYNNDGCPDIVNLRGGWEGVPQRKSLLRNNCDGTFTDVTVASGMAVPTASQTAVWTDFDNDGFLDLFVGQENGRAQLFRNKHDGTFEDVAKAAGVDRAAFTKAVAAGDYDNDGYPDLYVSNFGSRNFLYHNNRNGTFTEVSAAAGVIGTPTGFPAWFFDYDNDGRLDLFVTSYVTSIDDMVRDYLHLPHNGTTMKLYRNLGDGTFKDVTVEAGLNKVLMPMGSNFGDIDNDGFPDIFLGTGNPSYAGMAGSRLLHNKGGKAFVDVSTSSGTAEVHKGHGVAFADLDNDGDEDILFEVGGATPGDRHALRLFENPGNGNDWIGVKLVGTRTNRTGVGARIAVTVEHHGARRTVYHTVSTGGSFGASPLQQHIGLGPSANIVDLEVWWPASNTRQHFGHVASNQWLEIHELSDRPVVLKKQPVHLGGGSAKKAL